ncbi:hypothetical protein RB4083 [Rhodopirellula baltica SH 1]|uniref:Uncharacterized protein n=1 Tax=Rhodopirellula baltica (strain DSM 10527 / NCIMB 13988 / SH1) TaxID=243090 RepID=Q7UT63_RHOBA|nr:hypothetical protein RB4083 [Rhodopirellula baltica SH 1]
MPEGLSNHTTGSPLANRLAIGHRIRLTLNASSFQLN